MATVGVLALSVKANTQDLVKGLKLASAKISAFGRRIKRVGIGMAKFGAAAAVAASVGLTLLIKKQLQFIDRTGKISDQIDITTESLQGLRFAANLAGTSTAILEKGLRRMSRGLGEAKQGLGQAKFALAALGIELEDIIGLDSAEQFIVLSKALKNLATQEERNAISAQLFGRAGQELLNVIQLGSKGIREQIAEAKKLGIAFNRVDTRKVEAANDALLRMSAIFEGISNTLTIQLAPFITKAADSFREWANEGEGAAIKVVKAFGNVLLVFATIADFVADIQGAFLSLVGVIQRGIARLMLTVDTVLGGLAPTVELFGTEKDLQKLEQTQLDLVIGAVELFNASERSFKEANKLFGGQNKKKALQFFKDIQDEADRLANKARESVNTYDGVRKKQKEATKGDAAFRQVNLSRIAVGGFSKSRKQVQSVNDPQLVVTNNLLRQMTRRNIANVGVAQ